MKIFDKSDLVKAMKDKGVERLSEFENYGYLGTSNFGGIVIKFNYTSEIVFVQDVWDNGHSKIAECEVEFNIDGEPYFKYNSEFYYLNEFMKMRG